MTKYMPILLIVFSNIIYQTCTKSLPNKLDAFASLTVTYSTAAIFAFILFFTTHKSGVNSLIMEYSKINITSFLIGAAVVGIDLGNRYMYKAGWTINSGYIVQSISVSIVLMFVGLLLYGESITLSKITGIIFCIIGILFINR